MTEQHDETFDLDGLDDVSQREYDLLVAGLGYVATSAIQYGDIESAETASQLQVRLFASNPVPAYFSMSDNEYGGFGDTEALFEKLPFDEADLEEIVREDEAVDIDIE